jgi:hypothetical protein
MVHVGLREALLRVAVVLVPFLNYIYVSYGNLLRDLALSFRSRNCFSICAGFMLSYVVFYIREPRLLPVVVHKGMPIIKTYCSH